MIADLGRFHGKMLRPVLLLAVGEALGSGSPRLERLAAAIELIHRDAHPRRPDRRCRDHRGATTAHVRWGNTTSVLLGDFFYPRAFHLVAALGDHRRPCA